MNAKISIPELAALLALRTGRQKPECEDFLKSFFAHIADALEQGENVKIKGFGTFKIATVEARKSVNVATGLEFEIPSHNRVSFVPSKELAAMVNAPFDVFQSVEVSDDIDEDILETLSENVPSTPSDDAESGGEVPEVSLEEKEVESRAGESSVDANGEMEVVGVAEESEEVVAIPVAAMSVSASSPKSKIEKESLEAPEEVCSEESQISALEEDSASSLSKKSKHKFGLGVAIGFVLAVLLCAIACLAFWCLSLRNEVRATRDQNQQVIIAEEITEQENSVTENETVPRAQAMTVALADELQTAETAKVEQSGDEQLKREAAPTKASDAPIKDRITKTRYLTTMARDHYGAYELWPYIYDANPGLGHPSRIRPGTTIMVPSLSSLGIDPKNPQVIQAAKKKGAEIYARYNERLDGTPLNGKRK